MEKVIEQKTRVYISCESNKKDFYKKKIREIYEQFIICNSIFESEQLLCIGNINMNMEREIQLAKSFSMPVNYLNYNLVFKNNYGNGNMRDIQSDIDFDIHKIVYEREYEI